MLNKSSLIQVIFKLINFLLCVCLVFNFHSQIAIAETIKERVNHYPNWQNKPTVNIAKGDLIFPQWFAGKWNVEITLIEIVAPLAPEFISPGFEGNRQYLNQKINFFVQYIPTILTSEKQYLLPSLITNKNAIIADRAFNGLQIAETYLGQENILTVKVDSNNPNQQITTFKDGTQLISNITGRLTETIADQEFLTIEITQQIFRGKAEIYLNEVETTTDYYYLPSGNIQAKQITSIYLSPQDPNYFKYQNKPVALYNYHLNLSPLNS